MQEGSCFFSYDHFNKILKENATYDYFLQSSVSVRHHNSRNAVNEVRRDIMFVDARFCCSFVRGYSGKNKSKVKHCPAYFILQYVERLDCLVVMEANNNHVHLQEEHQPSLTPANDASVSKKARVRRRRDVISDDHSKQSSSKESTDLSQKAKSLPVKTPSKVKCVAPSLSEITDFESPDGSLSVEAVQRLATLMKNFLLTDKGAKATITIGPEQVLELLCFQTSKMGEHFVKFPESLLIHRVDVKYDYVLYAFLVESKERVGKLVHFSFVREDNAQTVSNILNIFQDFNPDWKKIKIIFTDVSFSHSASIKQVFPSAQILLSVYHTVIFIEKNVKAKQSFKEWLRKSIEDAIFCTSPQTLSYLSSKLKPKMDKDLYNYLSTNWFKCELLWYTHVKKGLHSCSTYMDSLNMVLGKISHLLGKQNSMESVIRQFVENADCFNSKGLENPNDGSLRFSKKNNIKCQMIRKRKSTPHSLDSVAENNLKGKESPSDVPLTPHSLDSVAENNLKGKESQSDVPLTPHSLDSVAENNLKGKESPSDVPLSPVYNTDPHLVHPSTLTNQDAMFESLQEHCNDLAFNLCSKEWEVVQKSTQVINVREQCIGVQVLEESHQISTDGRSCTCNFNKMYKLPCRHILSMLYIEKRTVDHTMVSPSMQKYAQNVLPNAQSSGTELHLQEGREDKINSLTKELSNLLCQCEGSENLVRSSTLQMIVNMWSVASNTSDKDHQDLDSSQALPYKWVKKEQIEGEEYSGSRELCRLDAFPILS
ncbi:zinc finger SWIM domain-containing protein 3 [Pelobates fuscus]|uniref:zinc finger SWIM domain-containing protein 3 n=1 Tax=Pelobates fuscus TaxID=191477 RepID=UPI002FE466F8